MSYRVEQIREWLNDYERIERQRGEARQMIFAAHGILNRLEKDLPKTLPAWIRTELQNLKEALTYEKYEA